jgi:HSP20 family protein
MYRYRNTFREMQRMQRQMERVMNQPQKARHASEFPAINVWMKNDTTSVTAELPGFESKDLELSVVGDTLTLIGSREADELPDGGRYHRKECLCGSFTRTVRLPYPVEADKVEATYKNGILRIELVRAEADKPKKISVKVN